MTREPVAAFLALCAGLLAGGVTAFTVGRVLQGRRVL